MQKKDKEKEKINKLTWKFQHKYGSIPTCTSSKKAILIIFSPNKYFAWDWNKALHVLLCPWKEKKSARKSKETGRRESKTHVISMVLLIGNLSDQQFFL